MGKLKIYLHLLKNSFNQYRIFSHDLRVLPTYDAKDSLEDVSHRPTVGQPGFDGCFGRLRCHGVEMQKVHPHRKKSCVDESEWEADDEPCTGADPYCRRMIQNVEGKISMVLQCGTAPSLDKEGKFKEYYNTANDYVKASIYHCKGDLCNSASDFGASKVAAVAVVAIAWMLH